MFVNAVNQVREAVYGVMGRTRTGNRVQISTGSGFMISPGYIVTCAHVLHVESNVVNPRYTEYRVIRAPEVGNPSENAKLVAEDTTKDIALLHLENPRNTSSLILANTLIPIGTPIGSSGFPLSSADAKVWHLVFRFQSAYISAHIPPQGTVTHYESDSLMYPGSSGCPCFLDNATVCGMQQRSLIDTQNQPPQTPLPAGTPPTTPNPNLTRVSISLWLPSTEIRAFVTSHGVVI